MSAQGGSTDRSKKLNTLMLALSIVVILFVAIIGVGLLLNNSSPSRTPGASNNTSAVTDKTHISLEGPLTNIETTGDITRTSLLRSMKLVLSAGDGDRWLTGNPDWRLFRAQADYVDGHGLAKNWNLVIRSQNSVLLAYVDNGIASVLSIEDNNVSDLPQVERQILLDSNYLVNNVAREKGINAELTGTHFSFVFNDDGTGGMYTLSYTDTVDSGKSFTQSYSAKNGDAIEDSI